MVATNSSSSHEQSQNSNTTAVITTSTTTVTRPPLPRRQRTSTRGRHLRVGSGRLPRVCVPAFIATKLFEIMIALGHTSPGETVMWLIRHLDPTVIASLGIGNLFSSNMLSVIPENNPVFEGAGPHIVRAQGGHQPLVCRRAVYGFPNVRNGNITVPIDYVSARNGAAPISEGTNTNSSEVHETKGAEYQLSGDPHGNMSLIPVSMPSTTNDEGL